MMPPADTRPERSGMPRHNAEADPRKPVAGPRQRRCQAAFRLREDFWIGLDEGGAGLVRLPLAPGRSGLLVARAPLSSRAGQLPVGLATLGLCRTACLEVDDEAPSVIVAMTLDLLRGVLAEDLATLPESVRDLLGDAAGNDRRLCAPPTPEQLLAARSIRTCRLSGAVRNLYLKSKALELVASLLGQMDAATPQTLEESSSARAEPFLRARDILAEDMENPPSLTQLAARVGMSETRLKRGFKGLFGLTPYGWLREQRLLEAQSQLLRPGASVSQVAYSVGYTNVSHFIAAFVRRFSTRPGELLRAARQQEAAS